MCGLGGGVCPPPPHFPPPPPPPPPPSTTGRLHLRARARLRVKAHIESRIEIDRALAAAQQAVELGAAQGGAGRWWLERSVREAVRGEVERLEGEHCGSHETVKIGWSVASRRARKSEARHDTGEAERRRCNHGGSAGAWGKER